MAIRHAMHLLSGLALAIVGASSALADTALLCADVDKLPTQEGARMSEDAFEAAAGLDAAGKLQDYLNQDTVSYDFGQVVNSVVVKGAILRLQALNAQAALDLERAKLAAGGSTQQIVDKVAIETKKQRDAYCDFMKDAVIAE